MSEEYSSSSFGFEPPAAPVKIQLNNGLKIPCVYTTNMIPSITSIFEKSDYVSDVYTIRVPYLNLDFYLDNDMLLQAISCMLSICGLEEKKRVHPILLYFYIDLSEKPMTKEKYPNYVYYLLYKARQYIFVENSKNAVTILNNLVMSLKYCKFDDVENVCNQILQMLYFIVETKYNQGQLTIIYTLEEYFYYVLKFTDFISYSNSFTTILKLHHYSKGNKDQAFASSKLLYLYLQQSLYYISDLHSYNKISNPIIEVTHEVAVLTFGQSMYVPESWFKASMEIIVQNEFKQAHVHIATIIMILTSFYYMLDGRSPLTGDKSSQFDDLRDICRLQKHKRWPSQTFHSHDSRDSNLSVTHVLEYLDCPDDLSLDDEPQLIFTVDDYVTLPRTVQGDYFEGEVSVLLRSYINVVMALLVMRRFTAVFNLSKLRLDTCLLQCGKQYEYMAQQSYTNATAGLDIVILSPIERLAHFVFTFVYYSRLGYQTQYVGVYLQASALTSACKYHGNSLLSLRPAMASVARRMFLRVGSSEELEMLKLKTQTHFDAGDWFSGITAQIERLKLLTNEAAAYAAFEIGCSLFDNGEYDYAQDYLCYAIYQATKGSVYCDERAPQGLSSTQSTKNFYDAVQSVNLVRHIRNASHEDAASEASNSVHPEVISRLAFDIYVKRVQFYMKLHNLRPAQQILKRLLAYGLPYVQMYVEAQQLLCQLYLQCSPQVCQIQMDLFSYLDDLVATLPVDRYDPYVAITTVYFYLRLGYYNEALLLAYTLPNYYRMIYSFLILHDIACCSIKLVFPLSSPMPDFGHHTISYLLYNQYLSPEFILYNLSSKRIELYTDQLECVYLYYSLYLDLMETLDYNSYHYQIYLIYLKFGTFMSSFVFEKEHQISRLDTRYVQVTSYNYIGYKKLYMILDTTETAKISICKELIYYLPYISDLYEKLYCYLIIAKILIGVNQNMECASYLLENSILFFNSCFMCGHYILPFIFDAPYNYLVKIMYILKTLIEILTNLSPIPTYAPLFLDAFIFAYKYMQNIQGHKFYPYCIQEQDSPHSQYVNQEVFNIKMSTFFPQVFGDPSERLVKISQKLKTLKLVSMLSAVANESEKAQIELAIADLNKTVNIPKLSSVGLDRTSLLLLKSLADSSSDNLYLYNKIVYMHINSQQVAKQIIDTDCKINIQIQTQSMTLRFRNEYNDYDNEKDLTIFESFMMQKQFDVQYIQNAADIVRYYLGASNNVDYAQSFNNFTAQYYKYSNFSYFIQLNQSVLYCTANGYPKIELNLHKERCLPNHNISMFLFGRKFAASTHEHLQVAELLPADYTDYIARSHSREDKRTSQLAFEPFPYGHFKLMVTRLQNLFKISPLQVKIAVELGAEGQVFTQMPETLAADPAAGFYLFTARAYQFSAQGRDVLAETITVDDVGVCCSAMLQALPLSYMFNSNLVNADSYFYWLQVIYRQKQAKEARLAALYEVANALRITALGGILKMGGVATFYDRLVVTQDLPEKVNHKALNQLASACGPANTLRQPRCLFLANPLDSPGRKYSIFEYNRRVWLAMQAKRVLSGAAVPHSLVVHEYQENVYCNNEGVFLPFYPQCLYYGKKEAPARYGQAKVVDCSQFVMENLINIGPEIADDCVLELGRFTDGEQFAKIAAQNRQDLQKFEAMRRIQPLPVAQPAGLEYVEQSLRKLQVVRAFVLKPLNVAVLSIPDLMSETDQVHVLQNQNVRIIAVPGDCVQIAAMFVAHLGYYAERLRETDAHGTLREWIFGEPEILVKVAAGVLRRCIGAPVVVW